MSRSEMLMVKVMKKKKRRRRRRKRKKKRRKSKKVRGSRQNIPQSRLSRSAGSIWSLPCSCSCINEDSKVIIFSRMSFFSSFLSVKDSMNNWIRLAPHSPVANKVWASIKVAVLPAHIAPRCIPPTAKSRFTVLFLKLADAYQSGKMEQECPIPLSFKYQVRHRTRITILIRHCANTNPPDISILVTKFCLLFHTL